MAHKHTVVRRLYRQLLMLYPRRFREQLGESMQQTFDDLCAARARQPARGRLGFVLWMFVETGCGVVREHALLMGEAMKNTMLARPGLAALLGLLLVAPLAVLEYVFQIRNHPHALNPQNLAGLAVLFGVLWLLPTVFLAALMPVARAIRGGGTIAAHPVFLVLRLVFLVLLASIWAGIVADQLPCFLGVPNCD